MFAVDLHIHTKRSDGRLSPEEVVEVARKKGLSGIAITDHDVLAPEIKVDGFLVIRGVEVSSAKGHILLLGVSRAPKPGISIPELLEIAREEAAVAIPAHPFDRRRGGIGREVFKHRFDAIEVLNGGVATMGPIKKAMEAAEKLGVPTVGGSDAHCAGTIGLCYTVFAREPEDEDEALDMIRRGEVRPEGRISFLKNLKCWVLGR